VCVRGLRVVGRSRCEIWFMRYLDFFGSCEATKRDGVRAKRFGVTGVGRRGAESRCRGVFCT
jgi:hypothetical protein